MALCAGVQAPQHSGGWGKAAAGVWQGPDCFRPFKHSHAFCPPLPLRLLQEPQHDALPALALRHHHCLTVPAACPLLCAYCRSPSVTHCQSWALFLRSYRDAWSRRHAALSLYTHPASHQLLCMRGGGLLTLLRPCVDAEALWYSVSDCGGDTSSVGARQLAGGTAAAPAAPQPQALRNPELRAVHSSLKAIAACLGSLSTDAFVSLLASGACLQKALVFHVLADADAHGTVSATLLN